MKRTETFKFDGMPIRIVRLRSEAFFVIRDICNILGLSNPNRALSKCCRNTPKYERIRTPGGAQVVRLVPPDDVAKLLHGNHGQKAKALLDFFNGELLPELRLFTFDEVVAIVNDKLEEASPLLCRRNRCGRRKAALATIGR